VVRFGFDQGELVDKIAVLGPFGLVPILLIPMIVSAVLVLRIAVPRLRMYGAPLGTAVLVLALGTIGSTAGIIPLDAHHPCCRGRS
jgi:hypothetical protein